MFSKSTHQNCETNFLKQINDFFNIFIQYFNSSLMQIFISNSMKKNITTISFIVTRVNLKWIRKKNENFYEIHLKYSFQCFWSLFNEIFEQYKVSSICAKSSLEKNRKICRKLIRNVFIILFYYIKRYREIYIKRNCYINIFFSHQKRNSSKSQQSQ